jgi:16S rRNA (guanine966-N2)-methyltransferase
MRIIAGQHKGRALIAPKGMGTRPTGDRTRESLFNVIAHADWAPPIEGARVIDLFAGSGALGLEAMSRGAAFCLFVETDHAARGAIRDNIEALGLFGTTRLHRRSATDLGEKPAGLGGPFTLAFLDPPYHKDLVLPALACLVRGNWLAEDALVIVETGTDEALMFPGWTLLDSRDYGAAKVSFLKLKRMHTT